MEPPRITQQLTEALRNQSVIAEAQGKLTDEQLSVVYDKKWFKLFVPRAYGGLELAFPQGVRLEEELAWVDGSLGWTVTLCSGANLFVGYIDPAVAEPMFTVDEVCLGGSGQASGRAVVDRGGYTVSGHWRYATGAPHNTFFTANCIVEQAGRPMLDNDGKPLVKSFFFAKDDVKMIADWNTFGLKATGSHSFSVDQLWVDETHAFLIVPQQATHHHPVYQYPFLQFAEVTLAANTLGMARHFVACAEAIIGGKQEGQGRDASYDVLETAKNQIGAAKQQFYEVLDRSWEELLANHSLTAETLVTVSERSRTLVHLARAHVVSLYPHCGILAADASSEINRVWRDLFTASQHSLFR